MNDVELKALQLLLSYLSVDMNDFYVDNLKVYDCTLWFSTRHQDKCLAEGFAKVLEKHGLNPILRIDEGADCLEVEIEFY